MMNNIQEIESASAFALCAVRSQAVRSPHTGNSSLRRSLPSARNRGNSLPPMPAVGATNSRVLRPDAFGSLPMDAIRVSCAVLVEPSSDRYSQLVITEELVSQAWLHGLLRVLLSADLTRFPYLRQPDEFHGAPDGSAPVAFAIMITSASGEREAHVVFDGDGEPENWLLELVSLLELESQDKFCITCAFMEAAGVDLNALFARDDAQLVANVDHAEVS